MLEANFSERIFNYFYLNQEQYLHDISQEIVKNYQEKIKVKSHMLEIFYKFCINY